MGTAIGQDDAATVAAAAAGDREAWQELFGRYANLVWSVTRRYRLSAADAADASQNTWLALAEHIGDLREPHRVGSWLATTAGRHCLRIIEDRDRHVPVDGATLTAIPDTGSAEPGARIIDLERQGELHAAFATLPYRHQVLLRLLFADPAPSYHQIARATGLRIGSIGPTRGRCLAQLRRSVELQAARPRGLTA